MVRNVTVEVRLEKFDLLRRTSRAEGIHDGRLAIDDSAKLAVVAVHVTVERDAGAYE